MDIIILALAVWRVASLLATERGPYNIFGKIRQRCGVGYRTDQFGNETVITDSELARLISCPWCNSVWLGAIASLAYFALGNVAVWLALPLALSAVAILFGSIVDRGQ